MGEAKRWIDTGDGLRRCLTCGSGYVPGVDREIHRRRHAEYLRARRPKADRRLDSEDMRVDRSSPPWLHRLVHERARVLKLDEGYTGLLWTADGSSLQDNDYHRDYHAWLIVEPTPEGPVGVGAAAFIWTVWSNAPPRWRLTFVWIAEGWRCKGVLSRRWPRWRELYGDFTLDPPLSQAMGAFVDKHGGSPDPA
jgi:hypothetical protein